MTNQPQPEINPKNRTPSPSGGGSALNDVQKNFKIPAFSWDSKIEFRSGPVRRDGRQKVFWSWMASLIDTLVLIAISCLFSIIFAKVMHTSTFSVFRDLQIMGHSLGALGIVGIVLITASWFYMVLLRGLFGSSIGEWACDLRLGAPFDEERPYFISKVIFRATLILATGVITLPILSFLTGKDIAGQICGLRLFSLK